MEEPDDVCCANDEAPEIETEKTAAAVTEFSVDLLKKIHEEGKNTFFSGYSIAVALGMLSLGARENTLAEIDNAAHFGNANAGDSNAVHEAFKACTQQFNSTWNFPLSSAICLYGSEMFKIEQQYQEDCKKYYGNDIQLLDFAEGTAEDIINSWVLEQTNDRIKDLFPSGSLSADTLLVLVNTIYFKAHWEDQFSNKCTCSRQFFTSEDTEIQVNMMSRTTFYNYYIDYDLEVKVIELLYEHGYASMFILLPDEINGLPSLINSLTVTKLQFLMSSVSSGNVHLRLPRFKIESEYSLKEMLSLLGICDVFDSSRCNLSAMVDQGNVGKVSLSKAIHKTFVQVTEVGTEAAAVTGSGLMMMSVPEDFNINHPFLFVIRDNVHNVPLFMGAVTDPPAAEESIFLPDSPAGEDSPAEEEPYSFSE